MCCFPQAVSFHSPDHSPCVTAARAFPTSHSVPLSLLQMVAACHPPCPGELLNHVLEAHSSSQQKEKRQKRVIAGGEGEIWHPSCLLLVFFSFLSIQTSIMPYLPAQSRGTQKRLPVPLLAKSEPSCCTRLVLVEARTEVFPKVVILAIAS